MYSSTSPVTQDHFYTISVPYNIYNIYVTIPFNKYHGISCITMQDHAIPARRKHWACKKTIFFHIESRKCYLSFIGLISLSGLLNMHEDGHGGTHWWLIGSGDSSKAGWLSWPLCPAFVDNLFTILRMKMIMRAIMTIINKQRRIII